MIASKIYGRRLSDAALDPLVRVELHEINARTIVVIQTELNSPSTSAAKCVRQGNEPD